MFNTIVGAGAVGAASRYGSGSDQKMRLRLRNTGIRNTGGNSYLEGHVLENDDGMLGRILLQQCLRIINFRGDESKDEIYKSLANFTHFTPITDQIQKT
jgi:hypothetical protein